MRVLGVTDGGDCGAAIVEDGRILAAVNEERLSRLKLVEGFPRASIRDVLRLSCTAPGDLDAVLIGSTNEFFHDELKPFEGWFQHWETSGYGGQIKKLAGRFSRYRNRLPVLETAYYAAMAPSFWYRGWAVKRILREEFGIRCPIRFVDHHLAHLASAYFTSGFDDALLVSMDGGGDGRSSLIYRVRDGRFEYVHETSAFNSLGNYYAYATHLCGFTAMKHEGKVTGLAAHGKPLYAPLLREFIDERDGRLTNHAGVAFTSAIETLGKRLPRGWTREDLAASIQVHCEDVVRRYVGHWARRTGLRDLALAGGIFANVRINEEVYRLPEVDRVFIHPHIGDGGLAVGAALSACIPGILPAPMAPSAEPLRDVYFGPDITDGDIDSALRRAELVPETVETALEERIADLLVEGYVVARASGRMEYGPRALGNRSILYHPTDRSVNDWLNKNLRRTEFMPFAPSILHEAASRCFDQIEGAEHAAEFMTITFHANRCMRDAMPGVIHIDGTARPQLVRRDRNEEYYRIIQAFCRRTGLPAVINTSFNMHEEPIVCSAADPVRAFLDGNLDYLALGSHLIRHPRGVTHPLYRVRSAAGPPTVAPAA